MGQRLTTAPGLMLYSGPIGGTTQPPPCGSQPSFPVRRIWKEVPHFSLQSNVPFDPVTEPPFLPSPLGFQEGVAGAWRFFPRPAAPRPRAPLQRVGGDPAGGGADPQAEGDADAVAGETAVQVVPIPERGRGAGRLPHGASGRALRSWGPGRSLPRRRQPRAPAPRAPFSGFRSAAAVLAERTDHGQRRARSRTRAAAAKAPGKSFRDRALPTPRAIVGGRRGGGRPPAAGAGSCPGTKTAAPAARPTAAPAPRGPLSGQAPPTS
ncbi:hypothetical protein P7K49_030185 [Saguinus oedipus]|uniref:Uncharacterized protein n=1 Tax=Saguinus oedipus TaxID=9490 RepID=A0ABQ9U1H8_SAGOE|nr:hypothetical protein P7K49_030185 [Saguinus oedipus]